MMGTSQLVLKKPHIGHIDAVSRDIHLINNDHGYVLYRDREKAPHPTFQVHINQLALNPSFKHFSQGH